MNKPLRSMLDLIGAVLQSYFHKVLVLTSIMFFELDCEQAPPYTRHGLCLIVLQSYFHKILVLTSVMLFQ